MKKIYYYIGLLTILLVTSCQQQEIVSDVSVLKPGEYRFSVNIPEPIVATRSMEHSPSADLRTMHVLVFDENGFFLANQVATVQSFDGKEGTYTVSLPLSNTKRILHFVLGDVNYDTYLPDDSETSIFSELAVSGNTDVYWQRMELENIPENTTSLPTVTLVRNFAELTLDEQVDNFEVIGYTIMGETSAGTVAPYNAVGENFVSFELNDALAGDNAYEKFQTLNPGFGGNTVGEREELDTAPSDEEFTPDAKYVYECNQDDDENPAYVLVKASYNGEPCYYKLDIVSFDEETYLTSYLNLYRNFSYQIYIKSVNDKGYDTAKQAMDAVASNNIAASVEVSEVNKIQDGQGHELSVDRLEIMLVSTDSYTLNYTYISNGQNANGEVKAIPVGGQDEGGYNHNAVQSIVCNGDGTITITPVSSLPETMQTQEFVVTTPSGLSRRITVNVRQKFEFSAVDCDNVEERIGAELTLVVRLPANMPTSAFPLTLNIEPVKKSIYPDVTKNRIPVHSQENYTFDYQATITYNDYRRNPAFFFHFKSNMAASATDITVSNPYFVDGETSFDNENKIYDFGRVTLNGDENEYVFTDYNTKGQTLTLEFDLHTQEDVLTTDPDNHIVEIFADYLDFANINPATATGTWTVREDGQCILFVPNDIYERQSITFTVTRDLASETIQLSSIDHSTATIDYSTQPLTVTLSYGYNNVVRNEDVSIYQDMNGNGERDNDELVTTMRTNYQGQITMESFANLEMTDLLFFRCRIQSGWNRYSYSTEVRVSDLVTNPDLTLTRE